MCYTALFKEGGNCHVRYINCSDCLPVICYYLIMYRVCTHLLKCMVTFLDSVVFVCAWTECTSCFFRPVRFQVEFNNFTIFMIVVVVHCDGITVDDITMAKHEE